MTNIEKLEKIGLELFGPNWITPVARMLGINDSTIRRWISGASRPSVTIADDLPGAIEKKFHEALEIACTDKVAGDSVDSDTITSIVDCYEYADEQDRKSAIDAVNNAIYETTYLSNLHQIARNIADGKRGY
ncbi:TPA: helix-turn-helix transcriptional regulator [Salmonella enterica]|nr:helix-turn-helix transcriptional regulator [Salmonella enterica]